MTSEPARPGTTANDGGRRELENLREPPSGETPDPEPRTALQELPFIKLEWPDFEKLVERLVELEGDPERVSRYGVPGDDQEGIDIYSRLAGGRGYAVYQCKRHKSMYPGTIRNAVEEFLKNEWAQAGPRFAGRFVFCTSHPLAGRTLVDEIETQAAQLRNRQPSVVFDAWGQEELSKRLKSHPKIVEDFFGSAFVELFAPGGSGRAPDGVEELTAKVAALPRRFKPRLPPKRSCSPRWNGRPTF